MLVSRKVTPEHLNWSCNILTRNQFGWIFLNNHSHLHSKSKRLTLWGVLWWPSIMIWWYRTHNMPFHGYFTGTAQPLPIQEALRTVHSIKTTKTMVSNGPCGRSVQAVGNLSQCNRVKCVSRLGKWSDHTEGWKSWKMYQFERDYRIWI